MKNVDLIISQDQLKENRERARKIEQTRKNYQKQLDRKDTIIYILAILIIGMTTAIGMYLMKDNVKDAYNNCIKNGYSTNYCAKNS